jgi:quercetin dioxygenase-like cupin family protein
MEIVRFDEAAAVSVSQFGSDFKIGPLVGPGARVRVQVMHVAAGGNIGFHRAASRQLLAIVAGSGWVTGDDRVRRPIGVAKAAVWQAGEGHELGSDLGLTAICVEGEFDVAAPDAP